MSNRRLPSPAMLVAICALVVGLTGSAVALQGKNSVKSNDIAPSAVKAADIHKLAVHPPALDLFKTKGARRSALDRFEDAGRPRRPVRDRQGPAERAGRDLRPGHRPGQRRWQQRQRPGAPVRADAVAGGPLDHDLQHRGSADPVHGPGSGDVGGMASPPAAGCRLRRRAPGTYTFSLRYSNPGGGRRRSTTPASGRGVAGRSRLRRRLAPTAGDRADSAPSARGCARPAPRARTRSGPRARPRSPAAISRMSSSTRPRVVSAGRPDPQARGVHRRALVERDRVAVDRDPDLLEALLGLLAVEPGRGQVDEHQVHVGAAGEHVDAARDQALGERPRVGDRLALAGAEGLGLRRSRAPRPWRR